MQASNTTANLAPAQTEYRVPEHVGENVVLNQGQRVAPITAPEPIDYAAIVDKIEAAMPPKPAFETVRETANIILDHADELDAALAQQGEQLDRAKILEIATMPVPTITSVEEAKQYAADVVSAAPSYFNEYPAAVPTADVVTREELDELKGQINDSFGEVAGILLDLQARFERLDERIELFNRRGGHKF